MPGEMRDENNMGSLAGDVITFKSALNNRLDKICSEACPSLSRRRLQDLIAGGHVMVNGAITQKTSIKIAENSTIIITIPPAAPAGPAAQSMPLNIIYEDNDLLVINKPAGLVVHPGAGNPDNTLVNALLAHCGDSLSGIGGVKRPGIVHRLDKETSGLLLVAKHDAAHQALSAQLADRSLSRIYKAIVWGVPVPMLGKIDAPVGRSNSNRTKMSVNKNGKAAVTHYKVDESYGTPPRASLVTCKLESGRTHQIRVHLAHQGYGLVGDPQYGNYRTPPIPFKRQALHAAEISFVHPRNGKIRSFTAPLPADMLGLIAALQTPSI